MWSYFISFKKIAETWNSVDVINYWKVCLELDMKMQWKKVQFVWFSYIQHMHRYLCFILTIPVSSQDYQWFAGHWYYWRVDSARAMLMRISLQFVSFSGFVDEAFRSFFKLIASLDFCSSLYCRDLIFVFLMFAWNTDLGEIIWLVLIMINYTGVLGEQFNLSEILDCLLRW